MSRAATRSQPPHKVVVIIVDMKMDEHKAFMARMWAQADYNPLAERLMPASVALVEALDVTPGQQVLDVAAGTGNATVVAAQRGAVVTASDLSPHMVERGRARTRGLGLAVDWVEADAEDLPFPDASFDIVTSVFGAVFAPRPELMVSEVTRVLRPGGAFGLTCWEPESHFGRMTEVMRRWWARPPDVPEPIDWGREPVARQRLATFSVECQHTSLPWVFDSPEASRAFLERHSPSHSMAPEVLGAEAATAMLDAVEAFERRLAGPDGRIDISTEYLLVVARKPYTDG